MRKSIARLTALLVVVAFAQGCATPYMKDRKRDAADIITATVGCGGGAKARVGPVQVGLLFNAAEAGLRGGEAVKAGLFEPAKTRFPRALDALFINCGCETFEGGPLAPARGKTFHAVTAIYLTAPVPESILSGPSSKRAGGVPARYSPIPYWTEVEAVVGVGGSLRLGLNVGEFIDFLLGWTTLDIFGDDLERRKEKDQLPLSD